MLTFPRMEKIKYFCKTIEHVLSCFLERQSWREASGVTTPIPLGSNHLIRYWCRERSLFMGKDEIQGVFFHWYHPKKLKYGKPRLGESTLT